MSSNAPVSSNVPMSSETRERDGPHAGEPIAELRDAVVRFETPRGPLDAVSGVRLQIGRGEAVGLVGESGSGKSTTALALLGLRRLASGAVFVGGRDVTGLSERQLRPLRRTMQLVMQDPRAALNPRMTIFDAIAEPLKVHKIATGDALRARVQALLADVGLPEEYADRRPAELSGGQLQRAVIARGLATRPQLLVLDEPISALDVSVGAQILNLLVDLRRNTGAAMLFIAHDLHAVAHVCDRVAVMYLGKIVEQGPAVDVLQRPVHPYTKALVASVPDPWQAARDPAAADALAALQLTGEPASALSPPSGCRLHPRCPIAVAACAFEVPKLAPVPSRTRPASYRGHGDDLSEWSAACSLIHRAP